MIKILEKETLDSGFDWVAEEISFVWNGEVRSVVVTWVEDDAGNYILDSYEAEDDIPAEVVDKVIDMAS